VSRVRPDLSGSSRRRSWYARRVFVPSPLRRNLRAALRDLTSARPEVRRSAAQDLAIAGQDEPATATLALVPLLSDVAPRVRAEAVAALGILGSPEPVESILPLLDDLDSQVRQNAVIALGQIGGERALAGIERAYRSEQPDLTFQALLATMALDVASGFDRALECLGHEDPWIASESALQLAQLFADEPGEPQWEARDGKRARVIAALRPALARADGRCRVSVAIALSAVGEAEGAAVLCAFVQGAAELETDAAADLRLEAIGALGLLDDADSRAVLERVAWRLFSSVDRDAARVALARRGDARATAWIVDLLRSPWATRRQVGVHMAGAARAPSALGIIVELLERGDIDAESAVVALARIGDPSAWDAVERYARTGRDLDGRQRARALSDNRRA